MAVPLSSVDTGRKVRLLEIHAGRALQSHLTALGLIPGVELEVIRNGNSGPFIISVKDTRLMLGRGMAEKIDVA
ncbi:MAG: ferrous iron transport protein A [Lentisphaerae bacterium]|jgi:ferrous iron transport protein A|nr:ferrous iron transport protein A [Lentisphaerota bacterium]MBT4823058.1 ferrous iron transport protein A [Lentisphaerota bacterium]MBT5610579.1 ferrous iron transport protein A [Lentisphaerota bacterium]MBT7060173.1 ferrous iron transport protein A [Lentisphaerota bacterium]MBT7844138.1 ferrous iron transport protein A [Lentisphaerota bacterium]